MRFVRSCIFALVLLSLPPISRAAIACDEAQALILWQATALRLHSLFGGRAAPPHIIVHQDASTLPHRDGGLAIGYYNHTTQQMDVSCFDGIKAVFESTVRHESTHHFLHAVFGPVPQWLNEGLATYMEDGALDEGTAADHINSARLREFVMMIRRGSVPELGDLMDGERLQVSLPQYYATCWAVVFAMMHDKNPAVQQSQRGLLKDMLVSASESPGNPTLASKRRFRDGISENLDDWEIRWRREMWSLR